GALARDLDPRFPAMRTQFTELLQFPGVLQSTAGDPAQLHAQALALLDEVLDDFIAAREREGGPWVPPFLDGAAAFAARAGRRRRRRAGCPAASVPAADRKAARWWPRSSSASTASPRRPRRCAN